MIKQMEEKKRNTQKNKNKSSNHLSDFTYKKKQIWKLFENDLKQKNLEKEKEEMEEENEVCKLCESILIISDDGFPTCSNMYCGIIYKNILDHSPEWRIYEGDNQDNARCGNNINPLLFESSFGCTVLCGNKSSYEMKKVKKWTEWQAMPHKEKSLYDEFQFITAMAHNSGIPKIFIDEAMSIHKDILEQKMFRGLNRDGIKSASIYISCKLNDCPRTSQEIAEIFNLDKTSASKGCSIALTILNNIERNMSNEDKTVFELTTPSCFIERYCSKLNINQELTVLAKFICKKIEDNQLILNHTPHSIASGVVFFVSENCNCHITKTQIKNCCFVSEVTINKVFKLLDNMKESLIPNCILLKYV
jgi:transcription initiation factor TFIIB